MHETPAARARYACGWVPRFAAAALVRNEAALCGRPVAVLTGSPARRTVLEVTEVAWAQGVRPGMPASEAVTRVPDLVCRDRDLAAEGSAMGALRDAAWAVSPRVELAEPDCVHLALAGLDALLGSEPKLGQRLRDTAAELGLALHVAIADTRTAARLVARTTTDGVTVVPPGQAAACLAPLPVACLEPAPELALTLERWGIRTLGELAALPRPALAMRLGPDGLRLQSLARGEDIQPFVAAVPEERWVEACALDWELTTLDGLAFILRPLLDRLCARLAVRDLGATALAFVAELADGGSHAHRLTLVAPLCAPRPLQTLLLADLDRLVLPAPVVGLTVEAEAEPLRALQADLFAPPRPSPRELGETLGRLVALVGPDRVGAPVVGDTHRPDAIGLAPFSGAGIARRAAVAALAFTEPATLVCRRLVPPWPATVTLRDGQPIRVGTAGPRGVVSACAGPWRTAGEWWTDTTWSREEWDVALGDGAAYRLALDDTTGVWVIDAVYD